MSIDGDQAQRRFGRRFGAAALGGLCLLAGVATPARAATDSLYAAPSAAGAGDCSTPADACSVVDAVAAANAASVADSVRIELAGGTYDLSSAPTPTALAVTFAGPGLTIEPEDGAGTPILDGMDATRVLSVDPASNVTVAGLQIESGMGGGSDGGGIENGGTLTVRRSTFSDNTAANGGGIANDDGATLNVQDSTFSRNAANAVGGGAISDRGTATVERSAIIDNSAQLNGGGIEVGPGATMTVTSSTIAGNTAVLAGAGITNTGTLTVAASTITGNTVTIGSAMGAAIATTTANTTLVADILEGQSSGTTCYTTGPAIVDGGYDLDDDGTCVSATAPATGSHAGTAAYGSSTYGAALAAYLASGPANNGGPTQTVALLSSPNPSTALANPALGVVPASFALPAAVGGVSSVCGLSDQRGVVPAAGASCDVGAYLLQATTTTVTTSAAHVAQGASVTYTATVTPAPGSGTVSFDDGAGHPATAQCDAQSLSSGGTATCTVSYADAGDYAVSATYSGDGVTDFAASASASTTQTVDAPAPADVGTTAAATPATPAAATPAAAAPVKARDRTAPTTTIRRVVTSKQPITLRGTAKDAVSVRRVRVTVARHVGKLCRFLLASHKFSKARSCSKTSYVNAKGTKTWSLKLPRLPSGRYTIWTQGVDAAGNVERKGHGLAVRIPAHT
ncbi:MAG TPA: Ig-like domain repeat protein [Baekduia sp.]